MLSKLKKSNSEGFTIIEIMIVLVIAALILLIVFLAIPALQRSSRNTQRKNDTAALSTSLNNYISNNNGTLPSTVAQIETDAKMGYYAATQVYLGALASIPNSASVGSTGASASVLTTENVIYFAGAICPSGGGGVPTKTGASPRSFALEYAVETGSAATIQCLGS